MLQQPRHAQQAMTQVRESRLLCLQRYRQMAKAKVCSFYCHGIGVQAQLARESPTKVEDPEHPQGPSKGPATKRQHLVVMRHGERIDEASSKQ